MLQISKIKLFGYGLLAAILIVGLGSCDNLFGSEDNGDDSSFSFELLSVSSDSDETDGVYGTHVEMIEEITEEAYIGDFLGFTAWDSSPDTLEEGSYTLADNEAAMALTQIAAYRGISWNEDYTEASFEYAATLNTESDFTSIESVSSVDEYERITDATVSVSRDGEEYTFEWSYETAEGNTVEGSYTDVPES